MPESAPHVTLLVNENFKAKDLGPVMKTALGVKWEQTENPLIFQSQDTTMIKILCCVSALAKPQALMALANQSVLVKVICSRK